MERIRANLLPARSAFAASVVLVVLLLSSAANAVVDEACRAADQSILSNKGLDSSFNTMVQRFNQTCVPGVSCDQNIDPVELYLIHDYRDMPLGFMKSSCERQRNYKMCRVTTKTRFTGVGALPDVGVDIGTYIVEVGKPACFPPTCSDGQANVVEPNPARCADDGSTALGGDMRCEVVSYDVDCPNNRPVTAGSCKNKLLGSTSLFFVQRTLYEGTIYAECAVAISGNPTNMCKFGFGDIGGGIEFDMTDFTADVSYRRHEDLCERAGGVLCHADVEGEIRFNKNEIKDVLDDALAANDFDVTIAKYGALIAKGSAKSLPQCFSPTCDLLEDAETLFVDHAEYKLTNQGVEVSCEQGSERCDISVSNVRCNMPTSAPTTSLPTTSPSTSPPTTSPSTSPPTVANTMSPSVLASSPPSVVASSSPSASPSVESSAPSVPPSVETSAPSVPPTLSNKPSSNPTKPAARVSLRIEGATSLHGITLDDLPSDPDDRRVFNEAFANTLADAAGVDEAEILSYESVAINPRRRNKNDDVSATVSSVRARFALRKDVLCGAAANGCDETVMDVVVPSLARNVTSDLAAAMEDGGGFAETLTAAIVFANENATFVVDPSTLVVDDYVAELLTAAPTATPTDEPSFSATADENESPSTNTKATNDDKTTGANYAREEPTSGGATRRCLSWRSWSATASVLVWGAISSRLC